MNKLKLSQSTHARACECASAIDETLCGWVDLAVKNWRKGTLDGVATDAEMQSATREAVCITIHETDMEPKQLREIICRAVVYCEGRMVRFREDINTEGE